MQAIVNISLKEGVLDPQGRAIARSLGDLGFSEVGDVRVGKQILLDIDETDPARLRQRVPSPVVVRAKLTSTPSCFSLE